MEAPSGTVTFLFTDIEGSTRRWDAEPEQMGTDLARHDALLREAVERHDGYVFATGGDGFAVAFSRTGAALECAVEIQTALQAAALPPVRMGVHTGEAEERGGDYFGPTVNRVARLMAIGHGGQVLVSSATERVAADAETRDLGEHRLRDLSEPERVFQLVAPGLRADFPPLRSLDVLPTNLPVQLTSFVGREDDVKAVADLLDGNRMVTLTGVGGVGKTRLAMQVAADLLDRYADGTWLVELAAVDAPRVVAVVAQAVGVEIPPQESVERALLDALRSRPMLLIIDNCEHIVREVRRVAELILREAPGVVLLTTSREGLRVPGEQLFSVPSLDDDAAARLFVERAVAVDPSFVVRDEDTEAIAALCNRLDGMPLAIELAAARIRMFNPAELERRVEQRFRLLTGGRGGVERHQTLRAAIDWSYDLLNPEEQVAFARLSVFAGGCTLDAAESVLASDDIPPDDVLDLLSGLVDKSLVVVDRSPVETRFDMYETIRQYAEERLVAAGDAEAVRVRHGQWAAAFARDAGRGLFSPDEMTWVNRLRDEIDNLQAAVGWAVAAGATEVAMRIGASFVRQPVEHPLLGTAHLSERAVEVAGAGEHPLRARALADAAWGLLMQGERQRARELLEASFRAQDEGARFSAAAYTYSLTVAAWDGAFDPLVMAKTGLERAELAGDVFGAIGMRVAYAATARLHGDADEAIAHADRALTDARRLRLPTLEASALYANGVAWCTADPAKALGFLHASVALSRELGDEQELASALGLLSVLEALYGDRRRALEILREQVIMARRSHFHNPMLAPFEMSSRAFVRCGRPRAAARCAGYRRTDNTMGTPLYDWFAEEAAAEARAALSVEEYEREEAAGAAMTRLEIDEYMLSEIDAVLAELDDNRLEPA